MRRPAATLQNNTVFLNVYDLQDNEALINFGLGVFHSGVEIKGKISLSKVLSSYFNMFLSNMYMYI